MFNRYSIFFCFVATIILWQLLFPGYILTLDMVMGPDVFSGVDPSQYLNAAPLSMLLSGFHFLLPVWLIQKILLFGLFFLMGFLSFTFLPVPPKNTVRLFASLFYTINPFVYTRFLAGHWTLLFAYALLPAFIHFVFTYKDNPTFKNSLKIFGMLWLISIFSLHFFVIAVLFLLCGSISLYVRAQPTLNKKKFQNLLLGLMVFGITNAYWIVPASRDQNRFENRFDLAHLHAFEPVGHGSVSPLLNILSLHGFWAEGTVWGQQFHWLLEYPIFWLLLSIFLSLVLIGCISLIQNQKTRVLGFLFLVAAIGSVVCSTGISQTPFQKFNMFLYQYLPFWKGFRDSQKLTGILALCYTVFSAYGVNTIFEFFLKHKKSWTEEVFRVVLYSLIFGFGFFMWGGFRGQIQPVWYPSDWYQAKKEVEILQGEEKVLFLPWHGYLSFQFNHNILLANPASLFFGSKAVVSKSIELKGLYDQETDVSYRHIDTVVTSKTLDHNEILDVLLSKGIKYIIFSQDLQGKDPLSYSFLSSPRILKKLDTGTLQVFLIQERTFNKK